ncbi:MAG TPA: hypothetical protein VNM47_11535 [Terriglobia bacterium]|nr:hypothetical protein [Terriglobia bacterium]
MRKQILQHDTTDQRKPPNCKKNQSQKGKTGATSERGSKKFAYLLALFLFSLLLPFPATAEEGLKISPKTADLQTNGTIKFTASVKEADSEDVTWNVNAIKDGNTTVGTVKVTKTKKNDGTVDIEGTYKAPDAVPTPPSVTVTAIVKSDPTKSATAVVTISAPGSATILSSCAGISQAIDCRNNFNASAYVGLAIDTFAASEVNQYLNPNDSNKIKLRGVGGVDFAYRLYSGPCSGADRRGGYTGILRCGETSFSKPQLWVYGETVHGVRSADVQCDPQKNANPPSVCKVFDLANPVFSPDQTFYILRNATSLEGFVGARYEFMTLGSNSASPANLYLKSEGGFVSVAGAGKLTPEHTPIALGAIATSGRFRESFLDFGYGRNMLFSTNSNNRWKIHAYLTWDAFGSTPIHVIRPFAEMTVDTDIGPGADSVQSYFGINFDVDCLFNPQAEYCK